ncbi:MAG: hypothetical protein HOQ05_07990 [Corynebacteriales bacterium]|nr:hypothetical protein [Mycobacteriales bacterium]
MDTGRAARRTKQTVLGLAITVLTLSISTSQPAIATGDQPSETHPTATRTQLQETQRQLNALAPYVTRGPDNQQKLELPNDGTTQPVATLAHEIINYQNEVARKSSEPRRKPLLANYPALSAFLQSATDIATHNADTTLDLAALCGDFANPYPADNPERTKLGPYQDRDKELHAQGYHNTKGYACGKPGQEVCRTDFTRSRAAGPCPAPSMRDQASHSPSQPEYIWLQEGEPNPETADYEWPTWNWGTYVTWWHNTY